MARDMNRGNGSARRPRPLNGRKAWPVAILLVIALLIQMIPGTLCRGEATAVSLRLTGWGWCLAYLPVADVVLTLDGSIIPRSDNASEIADLFLGGTLTFNLPDRTDTFDVHLRGTKARSLFFLREVSGGETPLVAELEGTWFTDDGGNYVACEGRLAVPAADHIAKPYVFVLRTPDASVPTGELGDYVSTIEAALRKGAIAFDTLADKLAEYGAHFRALVGTVLTEIAVLAREVRKLGTPYFL